MHRILTFWKKYPPPPFNFLPLQRRGRIKEGEVSF